MELTRRVLDSSTELFERLKMISKNDETCEKKRSGTACNFSSNVE